MTAEDLSCLLRWITAQYAIPARQLTLDVGADHQLIVCHGDRILREVDVAE